MKTMREEHIEIETERIPGEMRNGPAIQRDRVLP